MGVLSCTLACACGGADDRPALEKREHRPLERVTLKTEAPAPDPRFDARGRLKGSGKHVSWLELPVGLHEIAGSTPRMAGFEGDDLPFEKVRAYLEDRLAPRQLEVSEASIGFRSAKPTHTQLAMGSLDVTLLQIDRATNRVRLRVDDLSPSGEPPLPVNEAKKELARARERIE